MDPLPERQAADSNSPGLRIVRGADQGGEPSGAQDNPHWLDIRLIVGFRVEASALEEHFLRKDITDHERRLITAILTQSALFDRLCELAFACDWESKPDMLDDPEGNPIELWQSMSPKAK